MERFLGLLTFLPMDEVRQLGALEGSEINEAKRVLAFEATKLVHGEAEAQAAMQAAQSLFEGAAAAGSIPTTEIALAQLDEDARFTTLVALCGLCASRGEARKLIQSGGLTVGETKLTDIDAVVNRGMLEGKGLLLRKGKKTYHKLVLRQ